MTYSRPPTPWRVAVITIAASLLGATLMAATMRPAAAEELDPPHVAVAVEDLREEDQVALAIAGEAAGALGLYFDFDRHEHVVVFPEGFSPPPSFAVGVALDHRVEHRKTTRSAVESILAAVTKVARPDDVFTGIYFDPRSGAVVVSTTGDAGLYASVVREHTGAIDVRTGTLGGRTSRTADPAPHRGGAGITGPCSSGYAVLKAGIQRMVSAAHCAPGGVGASITGANGASWGVVTNHGPYPTWDVLLISGSHWGKIYTGGATGVVTNVKGAADPVIGPTSYCSSGNKTFEHCGHHAVSLSGIACDADGCTTQLAVFEDGTPIDGGDSGGPWYNYASGGGVTIRGSTVAIGSGGEMYVERWLQTKAHWSLTIMTS